MVHLGELISLLVAVLWTVTALFADKASHRIGALATNVLRLALAIVFLGVMLWFTTGYPYPAYAGGKAWQWLGLSALVGYFFGDWCLFNSPTLTSNLERVPSSLSLPVPSAMTFADMGFSLAVSGM